MDLKKRTDEENMDLVQVGMIVVGVDIAVREGLDGAEDDVD